jgi:alpha-D-ribose 1-methylphosphonate 5-triphosphate synthase subunit PhnG
MMAKTILAPEQRQRAWQTAYLDSLDQHPDAEIAWEAERWRELGASGIAGLCDALLQERRTNEFSLPAETTPHDLTALWQHVAQSAVLGLVRSGGQCLLAALRLTYWLQLTPEEIEEIAA